MSRNKNPSYSSIDRNLDYVSQEIRRLCLKLDCEPEACRELETCSSRAPITANRYNPDIVIPDSELTLTAARSGGPGGQHVNKTSTKVNLRWNLTTSSALTDEQKDTVSRALPARMLKVEDTQEGPEVIVQLTSTSTRSQLKNRDDVKQRLHALVNDALKPKKIRKTTKTPKRAKERRLKDKKRQGKKKQDRRGGYDDNPRGNYMQYQRNPYTDDELQYTALKNLANATEYSDRYLYNDVIDTIHDTATPEIALRTKRIAMDKLLIMAQERSPDIIPQINRIIARLGGNRRNPWGDEEGYHESVNKRLRRLCRSDLTPYEISEHLNVPASWVAETCRIERQGKSWRRNANGGGPPRRPRPYRSFDQTLRELEREYVMAQDPRLLERINAMRRRRGLPPFEAGGNRRNPWDCMMTPRYNPDKTVYPYQTTVLLNCDSCGEAIPAGATCEATCMETESGSLLAPHEVVCEDCL